MLQQTQVARVVPRYEAWLERWPTAYDLAAAPRAEVLREWVGLGYNRAGVRLREACARVARDGWPDDLRTLPGVGPYTAAAVGSFAFGRHEVAAGHERAPRVRPPRGAVAPPPGAGGRLQPGHDGARRDRLHAPAAALRACPLAAGAAARPGRRVRPAARRRERFEDTNRYVRGRIVAALAAGVALPGESPAGRLDARAGGCSSATD